MLSPLASLGVATLCFYVPITVASLVLAFKLRKTPILVVWFMLLLVCLIRIAGAVLSFLVPSFNVGIDAAALAILSAGGLPLVLTMILFLSMIRRTEVWDDPASHYGIVILRVLFLATLALTIAGVRMHAQPGNKTIIHLGERLAEAGAILSIVLLTVCMSGEVYVWLSFRSTLSAKSQTILNGNLIVKPFILLRLVYFCLAVFSLDSAVTRWNPLSGSMAALVCMALLPEFITVVVYLWVGYRLASQIPTSTTTTVTDHAMTEVGFKIDDEKQVA